MTFFNSLCLELESGGLSETVLESFSDSDNFDYFLQNHVMHVHVKKRHQKIQSHLKDYSADKDYQ